MDKREQLAEQFSKQFETAQRPNGEDFIKLREPYPEWMKDAIYAAHQALGCDLLPNDWLYEACSKMADCLADSEPQEWEELAHELIDSAVEIYTADLYQWAADHPAFRALIEEARDELGGGSSHENEIQMGQYLAYERIYHAIREAIEEQAENENED